MTQGTTGQSHLSAWQNHATDPLGYYVKAHESVRQHSFTKGKSCLTNLATIYSGATQWVDKGRATDVTHPD